MRLVDDDGKMPVLVVFADLRQHIRELLDGGDDDAAAILNGLAQIARAFRPSDDFADLRKLTNGVADLLVQNHAVGHHDDGIHQQISLRVLQTGELMRQPCNGIGFSAARAVLDQIPLAYAMGFDVRQQAFHCHQLMIARKDLFVLCFAGFLVLFLDQGGVVFDDAGKHLLGEDSLP